MLGRNHVGIVDFGGNNKKLVAFGSLSAFGITLYGRFLFVLNYHFLAAVQVSVYAGGVVILFIFAIFLTTNKGEVLLKHQIRPYILGLLAIVAGIGLTVFVLFKHQFLYDSNTSMVGDQEVSMSLIGQTLMGTEKYQYLLPFEVLSVLLLACIIGGILIARKK